MRTWVKGFVGLTVAAVAGLVACGGEGGVDAEGSASAVTTAQIGELFDVNDVSILFPMTKGVVTPTISVTEGDNGGIWRDLDFTEVAKAATGHGIRDDAGSLTNRAMWQVVSLRFDPCAPGLVAVKNTPAFGGCQPQVRFIAQPIDKKGKTSVDASAHIVFDIGGKVPLEGLAKNPIITDLVAQLRTIKCGTPDATKTCASTTAGKPLGVHPGIAAGRGELVKKFVLAIVARPDIHRTVAYMGLRFAGAEPWVFFAGQVDPKDPKSAWKPSPKLPITGAASQELNFIDGLPDGPVAPVGRGTTTTPLFGANPTEADAKQAFKVENTDTTHFFNTECVSCHTSSSRIFNVALSTGLQKDGTQRSRSIGDVDSDFEGVRQAVPAHITGYINRAEAQFDSWNVRNFGYFGDQATVSGRTLNETIEVVEFINTQVKASTLKGPGLECADDKATWRCLRDGKKSCFSTCALPTPDDKVKPVDPPVPPPIRPINNNAKDPCSPAHVDAAKATIEVVTTPSGASFLTLRGNNARCLSRGTGGFFASPDPATLDIGIQCHEADKKGPAECSVRIGKGKDKLSGDEARRFQHFFVAPGRSFTTVNKTGAALAISCSTETECSFVVTR